MKHIFTLCIIFLAKTVCAQVVIADPAVNQMRNASLENIPVLSQAIPIDSIIVLKVPVINYNINNNIPAGTCKIKVGLGSKMILDPGFNLSTAATSNYFSWTATLSGGQVQLTGDLIAPLPKNFNDTFVVQVKGSILGSSTITTNFLITNHNSPTILSDENGSNNNSALGYTIVNKQGGPVPVNFRNFNLSKKDCKVLVEFWADNEVNVDRFEIETSSNGSNFSLVGSLTAARLGRYSILLPVSSNSPLVFIRVKSIDKDNSFQLTETRKIETKCPEAVGGAIVYPNPAGTEVRQVTIQSLAANFNGKYRVTIIDAAGKKIKSQLVQLNDVQHFKLIVGNISAGNYNIVIEDETTGEHNILRWLRQ
jgi:hypothetical protein